MLANQAPIPIRPRLTTELWQLEPVPLGIAGTPLRWLNWQSKMVLIHLIGC